MKTVTSRQLKEKMENQSDLTLVNTLPEEKFEGTRIDGAINIPGNNPGFVDRVSKAVAGNKDAPIVVYCAGPQCDSSADAARSLDQAGFTNVFDYEGGADEWHRTMSSALKE